MAGSTPRCRTSESPGSTGGDRLPREPAELQWVRVHESHSGSSARGSFLAEHRLRVRLRDFWDVRVEGPDSDDRVGAQLDLIETGLVDSHLGSISGGTLSLRIGEVGGKIIERGPDGPHEVASESVTHESGRCFRAAFIVVEEHEGDVVPVLLLPAPVRRRNLREKETCEACDVHLDPIVDPADPRSHRSGRAVAGRESCSPEVDCAKFLALVEADHGTGWRVVQVSQQLELDNGPLTVDVRLPSPDPLGVGRELGVTEEPARVRPYWSIQPLSPG